jgi:hypothetical protein
MKGKLQYLEGFYFIPHPFSIKATLCYTFPARTCGMLLFCGAIELLSL